MTFTDFASAAAFIAAGRSKTSRPAATNTRVVYLDDDTIALRVHTTDVVTYHRDGTYTLSTGGWHTQLTKRRIADFTPFAIGTTKGRWNVILGRTTQTSPAFVLHGVEVFPASTFQGFDWNGGVPFTDGMVVAPGRLISGVDVAQVAADDKHNAMVRGVTLRAHKRWVAAGAPAEYDICEQCASLCMGRPVLSTTHLDEHIAAMLAGKAIPTEMLLTITDEAGYNRDAVRFIDHRVTKWLRNRLYRGTASSGPSGRRPAIVTGRSTAWQSTLGQAA